MEQSEIQSIRAASAEASHEFKTLINANDLENLNRLQLLILGRLQDSNAVLSHFNENSEHFYAEVSNDFSRNDDPWETDNLFKNGVTSSKHHKSMKAKILVMHPDAFPDDLTREVPDERPDLEMPHNQ